MPKRGDFFHLKMYRRPEDATIAGQTTMSKYQEPMMDMSTTYKFQAGKSA